MVGFNRQTTTPRSVPHSNRNKPVEHLSSLLPGVVHPVALIPMLREDKAHGRVDFTVEMMETKELLANGVTARFSAWCVPWLAMDRFQGSMDQFDRSWQGRPKTDDPGETVTPFFTKQVYGDIMSVPFWKSWGRHYSPTDAINTMYVESYNKIQNWRARNASKELAARLMTDTSLAPAFWTRTGFEHIVPDFDQAKEHGEVALTIVESHLKLRGMGIRHGAGAVGAFTMRDTDGADQTLEGWAIGGTFSGNVGQAQLVVKSNGASGPDFTAELPQNGITVSLGNLKKARLMQEWADVRKRFEGHDDDAIIDQLMAGIPIEDQWLKDPFLLDEDIVQFRQAKRYSSTAGQLDDSAVSGVATGSLLVHVPKLRTGGMIVVLCEILPNQLFERRPDPFMYVSDPDDLPNAMLDQADTEKVEVITNRMIDVTHSNPNDTFGFGPLNLLWNGDGPTLGGDFIKPQASAGNTAARNRIYAVEAVDPVLTDDFYIAKDGIHTKPFLDEVMNPFQIQAVGNIVLNGLTQFGGALVEATGNYDKLVEATANDKIVKE